MFVFPGPRPFACPSCPGPGPQASAPSSYLPALAPSLYLPALAPVTGLQFYYQSGAWMYIYLIIGSSSSGISNSSSSNFFGINTTNLCMPILVN